MKYLIKINAMNIYIHKTLILLTVISYLSVSCKKDLKNVDTNIKIVDTTEKKIDTNFIIKNFNPPISIKYNRDSNVYFDINGDGKNDFYVNVIEHSGPPEPYFYSFDTNCQYGAKEDVKGQYFHIVKGDSINKHLAWYTINYFSETDTLHYIAIKLITKDGINYGWIHASFLDLSNISSYSSTLIICKQGYCKVKNRFITAGQEKF
jgi:hypothetical protein